MKLNENKNKEQSIVLQKWKEANFIGTYLGFTGCGKTRIGTIAASEFIRRDPNETSIVIVPTEPLRDNEWEKSFIDWGYTRERSKVEVLCIQSAYKITGKHYNTVVIDEWHTVFGPRYIEFLSNNTYDRLLCLTATLEDDRKKISDSFAPVIWETNRERAITLKLVSDSLIFNLGVELTKDERNAYDKVSSYYSHYEELLGGNKKAFDVSNRFLRLKGANRDASNMMVYTPENRVIYALEMNDIMLPVKQCRLLTNSEVTELKQRIHQANMYWKFMRERRMIVVSCFNKLQVVYDICQRYPDRKGIIFSESTTFADKIKEKLGDKCTIYHSNMKSSDKPKALSDFSENRKQYISSVKALNAGIDVPECSLGIGTSGDSKKLSYIQRNGRTSRFIEGKISYYFNLYATDTQEISWVRNGTKLMNPKWISSLEDTPLN